MEEIGFSSIYTDKKLKNMYIERRKKHIEKKIILSETILRNIIKETITEVLGSFNKQHELANFCASKIKEMLDSNKTEIDFSYNSPNIKHVYIKYFPNGGYLGKLVAYNYYNKSVYINIGAALVQRNSVYEIGEKIMHELMHGNIFLSPKHYETSLKMELDIPEYYDKIVELLDKLNPKTLAYNFAYGLYSCFYQEVQALISQTEYSIHKIINEKNIEKISKEDFVKLIQDTETYTIFKLNLRECCDIIDLLDNNQIDTYIVEPLKIGGLKVAIGFVKKMNKQIRRISNEALKKCTNNAMLVYYELVKKGKIS